jgi:hypothetical protein
MTSSTRMGLTRLLRTISPPCVRCYSNGADNRAHNSPSTFPPPSAPSNYPGNQDTSEAPTAPSVATSSNPKTRPTISSSPINSFTPSDPMPACRPDKRTCNIAFHFSTSAEFGASIAQPSWCSSAITCPTITLPRIGTHKYTSQPKFYLLFQTEGSSLA